jgi:hypothetical protein
MSYCRDLIKLREVKRSSDKYRNAEERVNVVDDVCNKLFLVDFSMYMELFVDVQCESGKDL